MVDDKKYVSCMLGGEGRFGSGNEGCRFKRRSW